MNYVPLYALTRGQIVETVHYGALAISDRHGHILAAVGDPQTVTYLRSTAKPFQALPFVEAGGVEHYGFTQAELALMCASHSGTDLHATTAAAIQAKAGIVEADLMCGVHAPYDEATAEAMKQRGEQPTANRHNCSGKHSGMLAFAGMLNAPLPGYLDHDHPVQQRILQAFAELCGLPLEQVELGIDGCSAPNFATPLANAAMAYARLADPQDLPEPRRTAINKIVQAMMTYPEMVGGPNSFDTSLMEITRGRVLVKGGAEGYLGMAILPGVLGANSPALGITLKVSDGDLRGRARPAIALEVLRQLGVLSAAEQEALASFGPRLPVTNWRKLQVGKTYPLFQLELTQPVSA